MLLALPEASDPVKEKSIRATLSQLIRRYFITGGGMSVQQCYSHLYNEFKLRYGVDLRKRAENKSEKAKAAGEKKFVYKPLDLAEELGHMQTLYDLARELFV